MVVSYHILKTKMKCTETRDKIDELVYSLKKYKQAKEKMIKECSNLCSILEKFHNVEDTNTEKMVSFFISQKNDNEFFTKKIKEEIIPQMESIKKEHKHEMEKNKKDMNQGKDEIINKGKEITNNLVELIKKERSDDYEKKIAELLEIKDKENLRKNEKLLLIEEINIKTLKDVTNSLLKGILDSFYYEKNQVTLEKPMDLIEGEETISDDSYFCGVDEENKEKNECSNMKLANVLRKSLSLHLNKEEQKENFVLDNKK